MKSSITVEDDFQYCRYYRENTMSFINYTAREINCKVIYYGPELAGKSTNLQYIYDHTSPDARGKLTAVTTELDRALSFDFLPLALGEIRNFKVRFHLHTVPGQVRFEASRKSLIKGVDGIVFVADSHVLPNHQACCLWKGCIRHGCD